MKSKTKVDDTSLSYEEKELAILRESVDAAEAAQKKKEQQFAQSPDVQHIITIVEDFIRRKKLICYGGTAINNILPENDRFYMKGVEIPDYDFFSLNALADAKELADIYVNDGYTDVEAKAGVHYGTYKVFVNYIPVADVTDCNEVIYHKIAKEAIVIDNIMYAPPNMLRMNMYLELSRPAGDISRWEKIFKRLALLNKHYPILKLECQLLHFMRDFEGDSQEGKNIYEVVRNSIIEQGLIFIGGYASSLYSKYMPKAQQKEISGIPDFDVLAKDPAKAASIIRENLVAAGFLHVNVNHKEAVSELLLEHYEVTVGKNTVCLLFKPNGCRSYNTIKINNKDVNVATIDTLLNFFLSFIYSDRPYFDQDRIMCMAQYLFKVQMENRLEQKGLLKRFSLTCYGDQVTLQTIREAKNAKYKELKDQRGTTEYEKWFLNYVPKAAQREQKKSLEKSLRSMKKSVKQSIKVTKTSAAKTSTTKNSTTKNSAAKNSTTKNSTTKNSTTKNSTTAKATANASANATAKFPRRNLKKTRRQKRYKKKSYLNFRQIGKYF
jgi:hypothetical protein